MDEVVREKNDKDSARIAQVRAGDKLRIKWVVNGKWYAATVREVFGGGKVSISYGDGSAIPMNLRMEEWNFLQVPSDSRSEIMPPPNHVPEKNSFAMALDVFRRRDIERKGSVSRDQLHGTSRNGNTSGLVGVGNKEGNSNIPNMPNVSAKSPVACPNPFRKLGIPNHEATQTERSAEKTKATEAVGPCPKNIVHAARSSRACFQPKNIHQQSVISGKKMQVMRMSYDNRGGNPELVDSDCPAIIGHGCPKEPPPEMQNVGYLKHPSADFHDGSSAESLPQGMFTEGPGMGAFQQKKNGIRDIARCKEPVFVPENRSIQKFNIEFNQDHTVLRGANVIDADTSSYQPALPTENGNRILQTPAANVQNLPQYSRNFAHCLVGQRGPRTTMPSLRINEDKANIQQNYSPKSHLQPHRAGDPNVHGHGKSVAAPSLPIPSSPNEDALKIKHVSEPRCRSVCQEENSTSDVLGSIDLGRPEASQKTTGDKHHTVMRQHASSSTQRAAAHTGGGAAIPSKRSAATDKFPVLNAAQGGGRNTANGKGLPKVTAQRLSVVERHTSNGATGSTDIELPLPQTKSSRFLCIEKEVSSSVPSTQNKREIETTPFASMENAAVQEPRPPFPHQNPSTPFVIQECDFTVDPPFGYKPRKTQSRAKCIHPAVGPAVQKISALRLRISKRLVAQSQEVAYGKAVLESAPDQVCSDLKVSLADPCHSKTPEKDEKEMVLSRKNISLKVKSFDEPMQLKNESPNIVPQLATMLPVPLKLRIRQGRKGRKEVAECDKLDHTKNVTHKSDTRPVMPDTTQPPPPHFQPRSKRNTVNNKKTEATQHGKQMRAHDSGSDNLKVSYLEMVATHARVKEFEARPPRGLPLDGATAIKQRAIAPVAKLLARSSSKCGEGPNPSLGNVNTVAMPPMEASVLRGTKEKCEAVSHFPTAVHSKPSVPQKQGPGMQFRVEEELNASKVVVVPLSSQGIYRIKDDTQHGCSPVVISVSRPPCTEPSMMQPKDHQLSSVICNDNSNAKDKGEKLLVEQSIVQSKSDKIISKKNYSPARFRPSQGTRSSILKLSPPPTTALRKNPVSPPTKMENVEVSIAPLEIPIESKPEIVRKKRKLPSLDECEQEAKRIKLGDRISVYWPLEKRFFNGVVEKKLKGGKFRIQYDDGDRESLRLEKETFMRLRRLPKRSI